MRLNKGRAAPRAGKVFLLACVGFSLLGQTMAAPFDGNPSPGLDLELSPADIEQIPDTAKPDFSGVWLLDVSASDDPKEVLKAAPGGRSKSSITGRGRGKGRGTDGTRRPGNSRRSGHHSGEQYISRGAVLNSHLKHTLLVEQIEIEHREPLLMLTIDGQVAREIYTDFRGASVSVLGGFEQEITTGGWEEKVLVIETLDGRDKQIIQYLKLLADPPRLERVTEFAPPDGKGGPIRIRQIFVLEQSGQQKDNVKIGTSVYF